MSDVSIRTEGRAGRITLTRPKALNALTHQMCLDIERALLDWADDDAVALVLIDAEGDKAFCAGGDIAAMYHAGKAGDYGTAQAFWRDEYRMNALIAEYPKPIVSFLHGFVMGGGVGLGGHCAHRVAGESTQIAMPECGIGLVPDVGGSLLLARAPGRLGEYLGLTGARMGSGDALHAGFADVFVPEARWEALKAALCETGDVARIEGQPAPDSPLAARQAEIDALMGGETLRDVLNALRAAEGEFAAKTLAKLEASSPLSMGVTLDLVHRLRARGADIRRALEHEYRFTHRSLEHGDLIEGVRAQIIDKDRTPSWRHAPDALPLADVARMLQPVPEVRLDFHDRKETA